MRVKLIALALIAAMSTSSCAYFLSPDQRGNRSGPVDGPALFGDILWLIPGIIPGAVALSVDFGSGAIYRNGYYGRWHWHNISSQATPPPGNPPAVARVLRPGEQVVITRPVVDHPSRFEVRLVEQGGRVVAETGALVLPTDGPRGPLTLKLPSASRHGTAAELQLVVDGHVQGRVPCRML